MVSVLRHNLMSSFLDGVCTGSSCAHSVGFNRSDFTHRANPLLPLISMIYDCSCSSLVEGDEGMYLPKWYAVVLMKLQNSMDSA